MPSAVSYITNAFNHEARDYRRTEGPGQLHPVDYSNATTAVDGF